jgi:hypothetical protein
LGTVCVYLWFCIKNFKIKCSRQRQMLSSKCGNLWNSIPTDKLNYVCLMNSAEFMSAEFIIGQSVSSACASKKFVFIIALNKPRSLRTWLHRLHPTRLTAASPHLLQQSDFSIRTIQGGTLKAFRIFWLAAKQTNKAFFWIRLSTAAAQKLSQAKPVQHIYEEYSFKHQRKQEYA